MQPIVIRIVPVSSVNRHGFAWLRSHFLRFSSDTSVYFIRGQMDHYATLNNCLRAKKPLMYGFSQFVVV